MFDTTFDLIDALGGRQGGGAKFEKIRLNQIFSVQAKTTGNMASKVNNYMLVWLMRICWCGL